MKVITVVGTRPNFIKTSPLHRAIEAHNAAQGRNARIEHLVIHTGQHYDWNMSDDFFETLGLPKPAYSLGIGSGAHGYQVGKALMDIEPILEKERPDWVVVVGDVNASIASALAAKKLLLKVAHVEAGLRSHDWTMPEEINRILTDCLSDLLLTTSDFANKNLAAEGTNPALVETVGNIMIDTLEQHLEEARQADIENIYRVRRLNNQASMNQFPPEFVLLTLHRPFNVDRNEVLREIVAAIGIIADEFPVFFPVHPRTMGMLKRNGLADGLLARPSIILLEPLGYKETLAFNLRAKVLITDSGGLQEEATVLGTPCLILRKTTERPETLRENGGTAVLLGQGTENLLKEFHAAKGLPRIPHKPPYWDGQTAARVVQALLRRRAEPPRSTAAT